MNSELPLDLAMWDEECMRTFITENSAVFHVFASRYMSDTDAIDDFLQEAYIKLWTHRKSIGRVVSLRSYFFTILRNTILDNLSYLRLPNAPAIDEEYLNISSNETFLHHIIEAESSRLITEAIGKLSPQSRQVIEMTLEGKKMQEIADTLQLSKNTVKTVKYRALKRLSELLSKEDFFSFLIFYSLFEC